MGLARIHLVVFLDIGDGSPAFRIGYGYSSDFAVIQESERILIVQIPGLVFGFSLQIGSIPTEPNPSFQFARSA